MGKLNMLGISLIILSGATTDKIETPKELVSLIYKVELLQSPPPAPRAAPPAPAPPPPPPPPPPSTKMPPRPATPKGNPSNWVTMEDYPAAALEQKREGMVGFRLKVGVDGRVINCEITSSSGHTDLDESACDAITRRARFTPSIDANGDLAIGTFSGRSRWQIPGNIGAKINEFNIPKNSNIAIRFEITPEGKVVNCDVSSNNPEIMKSGCLKMHNYKPYLDEKGVAKRVQVVIYNSTNVTVLDGDAKNFAPTSSVK